MVSHKAYPGFMDCIHKLADHLLTLTPDQLLCVAIDGIDAAGKTTLANQIAAQISPLRPVVRASVDDFHQPRHIRQRRGSLSPEGYFYDAFNYDALKAVLLEPFKNQQAHCLRYFDFRTDQPFTEEWPPPPAGNSILLVDGVFLMRPELVELWDYTIWVEISFETCLSRVLQRDLALFGSTEAVHERYTQRYIPGQQLYLEMCTPRQKADAVIENENPEQPTLQLNRLSLR